MHTPKADVIFCILEGEAEVVAGDETVTVQKNDLIIIPKGHKRGVKALSELILLHVVQPPPGEKDPSTVHCELAEGRFDQWGSPFAQAV